MKRFFMLFSFFISTMLFVFNVKADNYLRTTQTLGKVHSAILGKSLVAFLREVKAQDKTYQYVAFKECLDGATDINQCQSVKVNGKDFYNLTSISTQKNHELIELMGAGVVNGGAITLGMITGAIVSIAAFDSAFPILLVLTGGVAGDTAYKDAVEALNFKVINTDAQENDYLILKNLLTAKNVKEVSEDHYNENMQSLIKVLSKI